MLLQTNWLPVAPDLESRLSLGQYGGSTLRLVARAFGDRYESDSPLVNGRRLPRTHPSHPPRPLLGLAKARVLAGVQEGDALLVNSFAQFHAPRGHEYEAGRIPQSAIYSDLMFIDGVLRAIREIRANFIGARHAQQ